MKSEGFATAFERLDREILAIRRAAAVGSLFAWNWDVMLRVTKQPKRRLRGLGLAEIVACALALSVALCSCGRAEGKKPDRSDPFEPPPEVVQLRGAQRLNDGSVMLFLAAKEIR